MQLYIYDSDLVLQGVIERITSFIWTRRYWHVGEFKLLVPFSERYRDLLQIGRLVTKRDDMEAGVIRFVEISQNAEGLEEIEVQGTFLTGWLGKRVVLDPIRATAVPQQIISRIVSENVTNPANATRRIPNITHSGMVGIGRASVEYASEPFVNVQLAVEQLAKAAALGVNIAADIREGRYFFNIYDGRNLTESQQTEAPAVFSVEFDNVLEQIYTNCVEQLRTTAYTGAEATQNRPRHIVEVGSGFAGLARSEVFINAADILQDEGAGQINALLTQRGIQQLKYFAETLGFRSKINQHANLQYKKDFDVGDMVTCFNRRWGVRVNVRITEISEVYQDHPQPELEIIFGDSVPAVADQMRALNMQKS